MEGLVFLVFRPTGVKISLLMYRQVTQMGLQIKSFYLLTAFVLKKIKIPQTVALKNPKTPHYNPCLKQKRVTNLQRSLLPILF